MQISVDQEGCFLPVVRDPLLEAIRAIRESFDLERVFETAVTATRQLLAADRVIIYQFNADYIGTVVAEAVGEGWPACLGVEIVDTCFQESRAEHYNGKDRINVVPDVEQAGLTECHLNLLRQFQIKANLVAPIFQGSRVWGLLIAHQCRGPRQWQTYDVTCMMQIAAQLTIAIQQAERIRVEKALDLERQARQDRENLLSLLAQIPRPLVLEETLEVTTRELRQLLAADRVVVYRYYGAELRLAAESCAAAYGPATEESREHLAAVGQVFPWDQQQVVEPHVRQDSHLPPLGSSPICSSILAPIHLNGGLWGILGVFQHQGSRYWRETEVNLVYQVAVQLTVALQHLTLHQQAQEQIQELQRLHQLKDDFLSTVSHELRTPLASIRVAIEMLKQMVRDPIRAGDRVQRYLTILENESQREINLVEDLLNLQRLSERKDPLQVEPIDLHACLTQHVHAFAPVAHKNKLTLQYQPAALLPVLHSEVASLDRIIQELLNNACKYTGPGGLIQVATHLEARHDQEGICLTVGNHSHIPPEELPRLFDKFYRVPQGDPWQRGGTGLGLSLVKALTELLGGEISVTSEGGWTSFAFWLPLQPPAQEKEITK
ncbi:MAG: GAF domain-containing sensor histidine kinase [Thermostichales cyanobacterium BF4_bins_65]